MEKILGSLSVRTSLLDLFHFLAGFDKPEETITWLSMITASLKDDIQYCKSIWSEGGRIKTSAWEVGEPVLDPLVLDIQYPVFHS